MSKLYQIYEEDLVELERLLPELCQALAFSDGNAYTPKVKVKLRRCQIILSDVRWNYGPPDQVERIEA